MDREYLVFANDVILPSQWYRSGATTSGIASGELRLLRAVLANAVHTWVHYSHTTTDKGRRLYEETETWFLSTRRDYLYAFETICEYLQLDPDYIRRGLRELTAEETRRSGAQHVGSSFTASCGVGRTDSDHALSVRVTE